MTDPARFYKLQHHLSLRWVARKRDLFHWHSNVDRGVRVRGGARLDALLASRDDLCAVEQAPNHADG